MITIDKSLSTRKNELLDYFRDRASESFEEVKRTYPSSEYKKQAGEINKAIMATRNILINTMLQRAKAAHWNNDEILKCILMMTYTNNIVMLEYRNIVWPYEYMAFSRRIGELWEPFCSLCFLYPIRDIDLFVPPLFSEVKDKLTHEIVDYIDKLKITARQKKELKKYYNKVWNFVTSGEIKLELDMHFELNAEKVVIDFKSGFSSNEKGNTNRLLLVASIYKSLEENYKCVILVRADEDRNNHYFQTLKNSGIWEAYCGDGAYAMIKKYTGFNIKHWINSNITWEDDFDKKIFKYLKANDLTQYLTW